MHKLFFVKNVTVLQICFCAALQFIPKYASLKNANIIGLLDLLSIHGSVKDLFQTELLTAEGEIPPTHSHIQFNMQATAEK